MTTFSALVSADKIDLTWLDAQLTERFSDTHCPTGAPGPTSAPA